MLRCWHSGRRGGLGCGHHIVHAPVPVTNIGGLLVGGELFIFEDFFRALVHKVGNQSLGLGVRLTARLSGDLLNLQGFFSQSVFSASVVLQALISAISQVERSGGFLGFLVNLLLLLLHLHLLIRLRDVLLLHVLHDLLFLQLNLSGGSSASVGLLLRVFFNSLNLRGLDLRFLSLRFLQSLLMRLRLHVERAGALTGGHACLCRSRVGTGRNVKPRG